MNFNRREQPQRPRVGYNRPTNPGGYGGNQDNRNRPGPDRGNQDNWNRPGADRGNSGHQDRRFNQGPNRFSPKKRFNKAPRPPKPDNKIYFIALLPTAEAGKEIIRLKQEFAEQYGARHAVKVLPHITLQVPFTADPLLEKPFTAGLTEFAASLSPFEVTLNGFGVYPRKEQHILYIKVEQQGVIMDVHQQLMGYLRKEFGFSNMLARDKFNPHITVAFKDLTGEQLEAAWPAYEHRPFKMSFKVNNLYFLRHNGVSWEVLQKCRLGGEKVNS
ncbi:2'-5' RNA ligase family protein [Chitinophaga agrisoli]|uniref:2'-5' RNA ligase family protein n=1 Tax=Chitinophaga agrisoli TaxID=2607653 RepID=A0A5B2VQH5_9BACT|nr:2'-5' RNA ligase family protein [Chitinophaga agrisoli]KAA2240626.1 2'-5' RNA ligase family protein [Chitinophaga agrisoli]